MDHLLFADLFSQAQQLERHHLRQSGAAAKALERAAFVITDGSVVCKTKVACFAAQIAGAAVQSAVQNQTCAQAGAKGQKNHIARGSTGAEFPLCQSAGIGVVFQKRRHLEFVLQQADNRHTIPARQVGRRQQQALFAVQRSAAADSDRFYGPLSRKAFNDSHHLLQTGLPGVLAYQRLKLFSFQQLAILFDQQYR